MNRILNLAAALVFFAGTCMAQHGSPGYEDNWPQWRGPDANGMASAGDPPVEWSEDKNVKWKLDVPGKGHATPVIWGDQLILLSAVPTDKQVEIKDSLSDDPRYSWMSPTSSNYLHEFSVISVDRNSGKIQWQTNVREAVPHSHTHQLGSWASNSPVTDGEHIFAYFGSQGLYCLDMQGRLVWERDFGLMQKHMSFGEGSSPVLYGDKLILLRDHNGQSFLYVLDKRTGQDILKIPRDEQTSWVTPYVVEFRGVNQVIASATKKIRSYDLESGDLIWECSGLTRNVIPMPVSSDGMVYFMSGFRGSALLAIDLSKARGDITGTDAVVWKYEINTSYTPSPILADGKLYFLKANNGYLSCLDAMTGEEYYSIEKLEGIRNIFSSPVCIADRIYIAGANGTIIVVRKGPEFEIISSNVLEDGFHASPVVSGNDLYLRGFEYLYCISEEQAVR